MSALGGQFVMTAGTLKMPKLFVYSWGTEELRESLKVRILEKGMDRFGLMTSLA